jgi:hypothetical protein
MSFREDFRFFSVGRFSVISGGIDDLFQGVWRSHGPLEKTIFRYHHLGGESIYVLGDAELRALRSMRPDVMKWQTLIQSLPTVRIVTSGVVPVEQSVVFDGSEVTGLWLPSSTQDHTESGAEAGSLVSVGGDVGTSVGGAAGPIGSSRTGPRRRRGARKEQASAANGDSAASTPTGAGDPAIRRTPHLEAPDIIPTAPGSVITVVVHTNQRQLREKEEGADVVIEAPPHVKKVKLNVLLAVSDHFKVKGAHNKPVVIDRDEEESDPVRFDLQVVARPPQRTAGICALFTYRRRTCGHVSRAWYWDNARAEATAAPPHAVAATSLPVHVNTKPPQLAVFITAPVADGLHFKCAVETRLVNGYRKAKLHDFGLREKAPDLVARKLDALTDATKTPEERRRALEEAGYAFWEAAPPIFRKVIWALVDAEKRPTSVYIASAEPSLPWELMIPTRHDGQQPDELRPLGVEFAIGRWTRGDAASPPQRLPVRNAFVIAPEYEDDPLDSAGEVEFVERRLNGRKVEDARVAPLDAYFAENHASLVHFICHGAAGVEDDDAIYLDAGETLRSESVRPLKGFKAFFKQRAPFVFMNACDVGRLTPSLAGGAGFPLSFGDIGARAVLAPLWPVDDQIAHDVALELYETALTADAPPIAEILRRIRARAYETTDADTYAAYAFYGDPLAKLELVSE